MARAASRYRTLRQLEKDGELLSEWITSGAGPAIRACRQTPAGWKKLEFWLEDIEERLGSLQHFVTAYAQLVKP